MCNCRRQSPLRQASPKSSSFRLISSTFLKTPVRLYASYHYARYWWMSISLKPLSCLIETYSAWRSATCLAGFFRIRLLPSSSGFTPECWIPNWMLKTETNNIYVKGPLPLNGDESPQSLCAIQSVHLGGVPRYKSLSRLVISLIPSDGALCLLFAGSFMPAYLIFDFKADCGGGSCDPIHATNKTLQSWT